MEVRFALVFFGDSSGEQAKRSRRAQAFAEAQGSSVVHLALGDIEEFALTNPEAIIGLVPAETLLLQEALATVGDLFEARSDVAAVYGDDARVELPDFSPQRLRNQNYVRVPLFIRGRELSKLNVLDVSLSATAALYSAALKLAETDSEVVHISAALSRSDAQTNLLELKDSEVTECRKVLESTWSGLGGGVVGEYLGHGAYRARGRVIGTPLVSIVIPTQAMYQETPSGPQSLVVDAITSIVALTEYENYEIVVVVDQVAHPDVLKEIRNVAGDKLRVVEWLKPFNFSQKMNFGVMHARGDYVLLLNDDVQVLSPEWLTSMLVLAQLKNAGMVGAMLYYEDDTIQHAGHAYYQGSPTHIGLGLPQGSPGPLAGNLVQREVSGVTAACALMPMDVFKAVGGFTDLLPGNFNDVDLCLKVGWKGFDIYWTPDAELYHFESKTRDAHVHYYELDVIEHRWGLRLDDSRYWRGHPWAAN